MHGHGGAEKGVGGGQRKILGRGEKEDGRCPPFEQGRAAEGPGIGGQVSVGVCQAAGPVHTVVAHRGACPQGYFKANCGTRHLC